MLPFLTENNGLLFLETSALDSTNVELAFETVLKGQTPASIGHPIAPLRPPWAVEERRCPASPPPLPLSPSVDPQPPQSLPSTPGPPAWSLGKEPEGHTSWGAVLGPPHPDK